MIRLKQLCSRNWSIFNQLYSPTSNRIQGRGVLIKWHHHSINNTTVLIALFLQGYTLYLIHNTPTCFSVNIGVYSYSSWGKVIYGYVNSTWGDQDIHCFINGVPLRADNSLKVGLLLYWNIVACVFPHIDVILCPLSVTTATVDGCCQRWETCMQACLN